MEKLIAKYADVYKMYRQAFHSDYDINFTVQCAVEHIVHSCKNSREEDSISYITCEIEDLEKAIATGIA